MQLSNDFKEMYKVRVGQLAAHEPHVAGHSVYSGLRKHSGQSSN